MLLQLQFCVQLPANKDLNKDMHSTTVDTPAVVDGP